MYFIFELIFQIEPTNKNQLNKKDIASLLTLPDRVVKLHKERLELHDTLISVRTNHHNLNTIYI